MQDPKKSPKITIWAPSHNFVGLYLGNQGTYRQSEKNVLSSNISSTCPHNVVNFGPLAAEIVSLVWDTPAKFQQVSRLGSVTARHSSSGRQPNFAALNRGRHLYSAGRPSRWADLLRKRSRSAVVQAEIIRYGHQGYLKPTANKRIESFPMVPTRWVS